MKYCKKCVQPDTRPGIEFSADGVCFACQYEDEKKNINWAKREEEIQKIAQWAKANNNGEHDCVIGVSGGKDSTFQAMYAKEKLGLNCLLVNLAPDGISDCGAHNIDNLIQQGFDTMMYRPNPKVWKKVIKYAFYEFGNPVKPTEYPLWTVSYLTALKFNIPLIIQGENPGITLGVTEGLGDDDNAFNIIQGNTLKGCNSSDWVIDGIKPEELLWYQFPNIDEIKKSGMRAIYLNYYAKEWGFKHNTEFAVKHGLTKRADHDPMLAGRMNPYCSIDADIQIVNQMIKYYKFGFGFITDETCYSIREDGLSRAEAIEMVKKYDGKCGEKYIKEFCDYIDISVEEFWRVLDQYVNRDLFYKDPADNVWKPKFEVGKDFNVA
ncbi:N-acetyl sugar amidotransferase [Candidatus Margulisiibacteriota bacterium]